MGPTLFQRVLFLAAIAVVLTIAAVLGLLAVFFVGLSLLPPGALALAVFGAVALLVGALVVLALGLHVVAVVVTAIGVFITVLLLTGSPALATLAALMFLLLAGLASAVLTLSPMSRVALLLAALVLLPLLALGLGLIGLGVALMATAGAGLLGLAGLLVWLSFGAHRVPLPLLGLGGLASAPAVPFRLLPDVPDTIVKLAGKYLEEQEAKDALTTSVTIGAGTPNARRATAHDWCFGTDVERSFSLDDPAQFAMGWTTLGDMNRRAAGLLPRWTDALTSPAAATEQFWPNLANYFTPFGIPPLRRVAGATLDRWRTELDTTWTAFGLQAMADAGTLYVIDCTIFERPVPPFTTYRRFTPATVTFLVRDPVAQTLTPFLIRVSNGEQQQFYAFGTASDAVAGSTWLYALQAAKTAATVWGIWLGHVYRLHIVTAAMQMTMFQRLEFPHIVRQTLGRQAGYLIGFDLVLLLDWSFPPPTSAGTSIQFLQLVDAFAEGRAFHDDDPRNALADQGLAMTDFTTPAMSASEIVGLPALVARLTAATPDAVVAALPAMSAGTTGLLGAYTGGDDVALRTALAAELTTMIGGGAPLYAPATVGVTPSPNTAAMLAIPSPTPAQLQRLNRLLLEDAFPDELRRMDWNLLPAARYLLDIYGMCERYVGAVIDASYANDLAVVADAPVQAWMAASASPLQGNVAGLPVPVTTKAQLKQVLTSLIYRITAHGVARMAAVANPSLAFVANFPPCLEDSRLPDPGDPNHDAPNPATPLATDRLLAFLPKTGTIGEMLSFIFGFAYTKPYAPFIPLPNSNFSGLFDWETFPFVGPTAPACNQALQDFRADLRRFIAFFFADQNEVNAPATLDFQPTAEQIHQWELNIET